MICNATKNAKFQQFVCDCDRLAAECFKNTRNSFDNDRFGNVDTDECCGEKPTDKCEVWTGTGYQAGVKATEKPKVINPKDSTPKKPSAEAEAEAKAEAEAEAEAEAKAKAEARAEAEAKAEAEANRVAPTSFLTIAFLVVAALLCIEKKM